MPRSPEDEPRRAEHPLRCAYCHEEIRGTPFEKNGYLYDSEEHADLDSKRMPQL